MKLVVILVAILSLLTPAFAESVEEPVPEARTEYTQHLRGVELAQSISEITGTAVSPLLGVTTIGAWRYYRTPAAERHQLPWFCQPIAWTTGFVLLGLCLLKDLVGTAAPSFIKKPLDLAELFENKLSAIVAGSAFVPIIAAEVMRHSQTTGSGPSTALVSDLHYASVPMLMGASATVTTILAIALGVTGFAVVWLACHAINVLIALSPFTIVDSALKLVKAGLLSLVVGGAFVSPWVGAVICLLIILVAGLIAPWAFRFTLFGTVFATDIFRYRLLGSAADSAPAEPRSFTARQFNGMPVRTFGRLVRSKNGQLAFRYRPWLILPARTITLPTGTFSISKGVLFPVMLHAEENRARCRTAFLLLPRYCSHESLIASQLGIGDVQEGGVLKGFKAVRTWLLDMLGFCRPMLTREPAKALT